MTKLHLNADLGERGFEHPGDLALLDLVDAVNIACGGHAGDERTWRDLATRARAHGIAVYAHPSYPDRAGFGRRSLPLPWSELAPSLREQIRRLPEAQGVKWHGALYTDAAADPDLAGHLADLLLDLDIATALAPPSSAMAAALEERGIACRLEGFADRAYHLVDGRPRLVPRSDPRAVHDAVAPAVAQVRSVLLRGRLPVIEPAGVAVPFACQSWCIHSDGPHATALARALRALPTC